MPIYRKLAKLSIATPLILILLTLRAGPILTLDNIAAPQDAIGQKLILALAILFGPLGIYLITRPFHPLVTIATMALWLTAPFTIERLAIGQWQLLAAAGVTPWIFMAISQALRQPKNLNRWLILAAALGAPLALYRRSANFFELIAIAAVITWFLRAKKPRGFLARAFLAILFTAVIIAGFAWAGKHFGGVQADIVDAKQLTQFTVGQGPFLERFVGAVSYIGFWAGPAQRLPINFADLWFWYIPGLIWFTVTIFGWVKLGKSKPAIAIFSITLYLLALGLVLSNNPQFDSQKLLNFYNFVGLVGLRETGKFMGLMLISQTIGFAWGFDLILKKLKNRPNRSSLATGIIFGSFLLLTPAVLGIGWQSLAPTPYPKNLISLARYANAADQKTIVFPWHRFQSYSFTNGKVVDQFAPALFERTVFNEMYEYGGILTTSSDPWQRQMAQATYLDNLDDRLITLLTDRQINLIVIMKTNDYVKYIDWARTKILPVAADESEFIAFDLKN